MTAVSKTDKIKRKCYMDVIIVMDTKICANKCPSKRILNQF